MGRISPSGLAQKCLLHGQRTSIRRRELIQGLVRSPVWMESNMNEVNGEGEKSLGDAGADQTGKGLKLCGQESGLH